MGKGAWKCDTGAACGKRFATRRGWAQHISKAHKRKATIQVVDKVEALPSGSASLAEGAQSTRVNVREPERKPETVIEQPPPTFIPAKSGVELWDLPSPTASKAMSVLDALGVAVYRIDRLTNGFVVDERERDKAIEDYKRCNEVLRSASMVTQTVTQDTLQVRVLRVLSAINEFAAQDKDGRNIGIIQGMVLGLSREIESWSAPTAQTEVEAERAAFMQGAKAQKDYVAAIAPAAGEEYTRFLEQENLRFCRALTAIADFWYHSGKIKVPEWADLAIEALSKSDPTARTRPGDSKDG